MDSRFVSRAGQKLEYALDQFGIDITGKICADLGCSTGGFTDCLLQRGAQKIYAVDTAYGELNWKLRQNPRVVVKEKTNALHVVLPEEMDFISIDVGWTPQKLILPRAIELLKNDGDIISLLKPHYEAERHWLDKGKVKPEYLGQIIEKVKNDLSDLDITIRNIIESPITGRKGENIEYLMWIRKLYRKPLYSFENSESGITSVI